VGTNEDIIPEPGQILIDFTGAIGNIKNVNLATREIEYIIFTPDGMQLESSCSLEDILNGMVRICGSHFKSAYIKELRKFGENNKETV